jgi:hypothetical protein
MHQKVRPAQAIDDHIAYNTYKENTLALVLTNCSITRLASIPKHPYTTEASGESETALIFAYHFRKNGALASRKRRR